MENYRTLFHIPESEHKITYETPLFFIGSCFTENIGKKLEELKFQVEINPFGVIYNPFSVKNSLEMLMDDKVFTAEDLYHFNDQWISFYHQTSFSDPDLENCLQHINDKNRRASAFLKKAEFLFITFGTARIFEWKETGQVVSNCHKIPASKFARKLLSPEEITEMYISLVQDLTDFNPGLKIIFTVSPVRHWKDGATGNQISKSVLLVAIHSLLEHFPQNLYFPAYEIVMDDLRDYRFYAEDMLHLNKTAVDYIWDKFENTFIDKENRAITKEIRQLVLAMSHRPMKSDSESHRKFLKANLEKVIQLQKRFPFLDVRKEIDYFSGKNQE